MKGWDEYGTTIQLYVDGELNDQDLEAFHAHLARCADCQIELKAEEELSALLRRTRPLYSASDTLHASVLKIFESGPAIGSRAQVASWVAFAAATLLVAAGLLFLPALRKQLDAARYIDTAIAAHRSFVSGGLPLEIQSGSPKVITSWFTGKVPFTFRLPNSAEHLERQPVYQLTGGRLVTYKGGYAALVAYQMQQQKISLLVSSTSSAVAAGGEEVSAGGVQFHYRKQADLNIVTWSNHGLTYALVSSLSGSGRQSCMVCHQDMPDGNTFSANR
jgi:anti-sigma factor RsiW